MARDLTSDITEPAITHVCLDEVSVQFKRNLDLSVRPQESDLFVMFRFYSADGIPRRTMQLHRTGDQLPPAIVNAYRDFHSALLAAAQAAGIIPAGSDTQDL